MSEKELLSQLKSLKSIKMEAKLKESNKQVLMTQISNTISKDAETKSFNSFSFLVRNILSMSSRPAMIFAGVFLFLIASLVLGSDLYKNSKPTDSLYIARVISERARLNTTFSNSERERLAVQFAKNHARDITNALMDPEFNNEENKDKIEKLTNSFMLELAKVKNSIPPLVDFVEEVDSEVVVSTASTLIEENGIEISVNDDKFIEKSDANLNSLKEEEGEVSQGDVLILDDIASTSEEIKELENRIEELSGQIEDEENEKTLTKEKVEEIERLFAEGKYSEVLLMLNNTK